MAKHRMINTKFWSDTYIADLDSLEKLLFLYFMTNNYTNICGVYEIPLKQVALDTGIDRENIEKVILPRFKKAKKIYYFDGWIYIRNFLKHQKSSGNVKLGIKNGLKEVPEAIMAKIKAIEDTPPCVPPHSLKLELELELEPELKDSSEQSSQINPIISLFKEVNPNYERVFANKTQRASIERMLKKFSQQELSAIIQSLPISNKEQYAPTVTTPCQLEDKLGQLKAFWDKRKANKPKVANI